MNIIKLEGHHKSYIDIVIMSMREQHKSTHGHDICEEATKKYCISNVYCMVNSNHDLIGFFSLSRLDLAIKSTLLSFLILLYNLFLGKLYVYDVYILPQYRKQGNGILMMSLLIKYVEQNIFHVNTICLHAASPSLIPFYEKCGFHFVNFQHSNIYMSYTAFSS